MKALTSVFTFVAYLATWLSLSNVEAFAVEGKLKACTTVPELGSLLRELGGERIAVTVFAKATEDPHFVEARPSFIRAMNECDLYAQVGLELEIGWAPALLQNARNAKVLRGSAGFLDTSQAIAPLDVPARNGSASCRNTAILILACPCFRIPISLAGSSLSCSRSSASSS